MSGFAGTMNEQVDLLRRTPGWDAVAEHGQDWTLIDAVWASARPFRRDGEDGRWRIVMRRCDVAVGDRIARAVATIEVKRVTADPAFPDRVTVIGEEVR